MNPPHPPYHFAVQLALGANGAAHLNRFFSTWYRIVPATPHEQRLGIDRWFHDLTRPRRFAVEYKTDHVAARTGNAFIETIPVDVEQKAGWAFTAQAELVLYYGAGAEPGVCAADGGAAGAAAVLAAGARGAACAQPRLPDARAAGAAGRTESLLLDLGLRVGEVARLQMSDFDPRVGEMRFLRPKVDKVQTHKLSADTLRALHAWVESGDAPRNGSLLRGSRKGGALTDTGMSERAITQRVQVLGEEVGLEGLSAHDCRHYWATYWARKVDVLRLQEAGGWSSLAMPRRYVEDSENANEDIA